MAMPGAAFELLGYLDLVAVELLTSIKSCEPGERIVS